MDFPARDGFGHRERLAAPLLTDVERSTEHWHRDPQRMAAAMDLVDMAVERSVAPGDGDIVRSRGEGDSHFVVFRATSAVRAAATLQRLLSETPWPAGLVLEGAGRVARWRCQAAWE